MENCNERFGVTPQIIAATTRKTVFSGSGTTVYVTDGSVNVPNKPARGLTYRVKCWGTKTGTNAVHAINLVLAGTEVLSVEAQATTAVDWVAELIVSFESPAVQRAAGWMSSEGLGAAADVADGAIDCSAGGALRLQIEKHTSDDVSIDGLIIDRFVLPGSQGISVTE